MKTKYKLILAVLGACNKVMSIFIPIAIALLIINTMPELPAQSQIILIIIASLSSLFRAVSLWIE